MTPRLHFCNLLTASPGLLPLVKLAVIVPSHCRSSRLLSACGLGRQAICAWPLAGRAGSLFQAVVMTRTSIFRALENGVRRLSDLGERVFLSGLLCQDRIGRQRNKSSCQPKLIVPHFHFPFCSIPGVNEGTDMLTQPKSSPSCPPPCDQGSDKQNRPSRLWRIATQCHLACRERASPYWARHAACQASCASFRRAP